MSILQPVGQVRMTNIALVRYKVGGKRFEIACYRNKVLDWRNKLEKDINEVLQSDAVYLNVSRGTLANRKELKAAFGTEDLKQVIQIILDKGQLQVSKKEREQEMVNKFQEIATIIADKCINSSTRRPFTVELIEQSMRDLHVNVRPKKSAKQQALDVIQLLQKSLPISRARMRVRVECPARQAKELKTWLLQQHGPKEQQAQKAEQADQKQARKKAGGKRPSKQQQQPQAEADAEEEDKQAEAADKEQEQAEEEPNSWSLEREDLSAPHAAELVLLIDPGLYRALDEKVQQLTKGQGLVDVMDLKGDVQDGDMGQFGDVYAEDQFHFDY